MTSGHPAGGRPVMHDPAGVPAPVGLYSHCSQVTAGSELYFVAGQVAVGTDGRVVGEDDFEAQVRLGGAADGHAVFGGTLGGPDVGLIAAGGGVTPGLHHFGLQLAEVELAAAHGRLAALGVPVLLETDTPAKRSLVITDPDGIRLRVLRPGADPVPARPPAGAAFLYIVWQGARP